MLLQATAISEITRFVIPSIGPGDTGVNFPSYTWDRNRITRPAIIKFSDNLSFENISFDARYNIVIKTAKFHVPNIPGLESIKRSSSGSDNLYRINLDVRKISDDTKLGSIDIPITEIGVETEINFNFQPFNNQDDYYLNVAQDIVGLRYDARNLQAIYNDIDTFCQVELKIESMEY